MHVLGCFFFSSRRRHTRCALVTGVQTCALPIFAFPAGRTRQEFPDVSAQIRPQTVSFAAANTAIVEQNFDYDLLSPNALMQKAVGETITLLRTNPATGAETRERAKVLAVNEIGRASCRERVCQNV